MERILEQKEIQVAVVGLCGTSFGSGLCGACAHHRL